MILLWVYGENFDALEEGVVLLGDGTLWRIILPSRCVLHTDLSRCRDSIYGYGGAV
jgi:hypothetical protein